MHLKRARYFARKQDWHASVLAYEKVLSHVENNHKLWEQYGHALKESGSFENAISAYRKSIILNRYNKELYVHLGYLLKETGNIRESELIFRKYFDIPGKNQDIKSILLEIGIKEHDIHNLYAEQSNACSAEELEEYIEILRKTPLFDVEWYRTRYNLAGDDDFIYKEYIFYRKRPYRKTSELFDGEVYVRSCGSFPENEYAPLIHYLKIGMYNGSFCCDLNLDRNSLDQVNKRPLCLSLNPLVSIIVTNKNGEKFLEKLFNSINDQTYRNFEIIFVDDCSSDNSINIAKNFSITKVVDVNSDYGSPVGFAKANNIGYNLSDGEIILLQNNDTYLDVNCIEFLVKSLQQDEYIAAASPKIRFFEKFARVTIVGSKEFSLDFEKTLSELSYKKMLSQDWNRIQ